MSEARKVLMVLAASMVAVLIALLAVTLSVRTKVTGVPDSRRAVGWESYVASPDGRTLMLSYSIGSPPCALPDGVRVEETDSVVRVTIYQRDESRGRPCTAIALLKSASVALASPLGTRSVVDGVRS